MKKWGWLLAVLLLMAAVIYFISIRSSIFFAVSISPSALLYLKGVAAILLFL